MKATGHYTVNDVGFYAKHDRFTRRDPVMVDVDRDTLMVTPEHIRARDYATKPKQLSPSTTLARPCDLDAIALLWRALASGD